MTFHTTVIASACERSGGYYTAGLIGITFRVLDAIVLMLLGTDALAPGMLLLVPVRVRTVVLVGDVFFLSTEQVGLELLIGKGGKLFFLVLYIF